MVLFLLFVLIILISAATYLFVFKKRRPMLPVVQPPAPQKPLMSMEVRGIVSFPGGRLAIVNDQIVKVGDRVDGHRVEDITDNEVRLRQPDGKPRFVRPPNIAAMSPAERER